VILLATIPLALSLHLSPRSFVKLPPSLLAAITFPDFSQLASAVSLKHILMFTLVGSLESLLTVSAIDSLDPQKQESDLNRDLIATGAANTLAACLGGIPMISEVVRSKANMDNGAKSAWANFFHGLFLLLTVALVPGILQKIPLAALAAMLIVIGFRLASVQQFKSAWQAGKVSFILFVTTLVVTLATDLLIGVAVGLVLKLILSRTKWDSK
uniref:SulP family inorganic anion transporter n=1 Tax=Armatimonas sp. TaxID=1872638 RepID=UPI00286C18FE